VRQSHVEPDRQYLDPRLAALYDALNPPDASSDFYAGLIGAAPRRVLDIGCGTGQLALRLAEAGHAVTGADPAPPMLDIARRHDPAGRVTWIAADARTMRLGRRFDVAIMTGHVFQIMLTDDDVAAVLATAREHLVPGGVLAFEARNPGARAWEQWTRERSTRTLCVELFGAVTVSHEVVEVAGDIVRFTTRHELGASGETIETESSLRFLDAEAIADRVRAAGFGPIALHGDWDRSPVTPVSPEIIVVATLPA
jgi:2-polyprenyl-3-methyl-5-hydroxy-6-metoxy-1,4-benzoquinol methylase